MSGRATARDLSRSRVPRRTPGPTRSGSILSPPRTRRRIPGTTTLPGKSPTLCTASPPSGRNWTDWRDACLVGRAAARQARDPQAEAWMLTGVGVAGRRLRRFDEVIDFLKQALAIHREMGDRYSEAWSLDYLGLTLHHLRGNDEAHA